MVSVVGIQFECVGRCATLKKPAFGWTSRGESRFDLLAAVQYATLMRMKAGGFLGGGVCFGRSVGGQGMSCCHIPVKRGLF